MRVPDRESLTCSRAIPNSAIYHVRKVVVSHVECSVLDCYYVS